MDRRTVLGAGLAAAGATYLGKPKPTQPRDVVYTSGTAWRSLPFAATEVIASWSASTPGDSWLEIELQGVTELGNTTKWYSLGRWAETDASFLRTSVTGQGDADGTVYTDTFAAAAGHGLTSYQLRVTLHGAAVLHSIGSMASRMPDAGKVTPSTPAAAQGIVLDVPRYSQQIHIGQYPQWDGGGQAWCSPTSTSMVLSFWGAGPTPADYAWVDPSFADPWVCHAARSTYDHAYQGCGNWPFNTAYASRFGVNAFVTRLRSLNEAEKFIAAGIPLIFSASFKKGQIPGLNYGTNGHLLVLAGFDANGQPVLNDPNAPSNPEVRKTVGRAEFEAAWLNSSNGIVYVIHPQSVPLPPRQGQANW